MNRLHALLCALGLVVGMLFAMVVLLREPFFRHSGKMLYASSSGRVFGAILGDSIAAALPPCHHVVNVSTPGLRAARFPRWFATFVAKSPAAIVVVLIGINDLRAGASPEEVSENVIGLVNAIRNRNTSVPILILGIVPVGAEYSDSTSLNMRIAKTNQILMERGRKYSSEFLALGPHVGGGELHPNLSDDGLHLNKKGISVLSRLLTTHPLGANVFAGCWVK